MKARNREFILFHVLEGHGAVVVEIGKVLHGRIFLGLRIGRQTLSENLRAWGKRGEKDGKKIRSVEGMKRQKYKNKKPE